MPNRDLIVIGASAGGIEALRGICGALPADLNAAILIVMHTSNHDDRADNAETNSETLRNFLVQVANPESDVDEAAESI